MIDRRALLRLLSGLASLAWLPWPLRAAGDGWAPLPPETTVIDRIAFGSCADQRPPQPFWDVILAEAPQLLILMGDNVYGDVSSAEMIELREAYAALAAQPGFQRARARVPILPIWDDHDYGANDAGGDFPHRQESAALFRAFWRVPADSARGQRVGLYEACMFGPAGRRLQVILLDMRSFRSPLRPTDERGAPGKERYLPDPDPAKTMLGEAQWAWLTERLREPADLRLLVSSIQVLAEGHGWERWGNLPLERERLIRLIAETGAGGIVFLSGDRHLGSIYERTGDAPYPLYEITSSSFNRPFRDAREQDPLQQGDIYTEANFGMVRIDWPAGRVALELRADDGALVRSAIVDLSLLSTE
jgi:alkaline phosphatase D